MKRLILTILLLLIASPAYPFGGAMMAAASAGGAAGLTCTAGSGDSVLFTYGSGGTSGSIATGGAAIRAQGFTVSQAIRITKYAVRLEDVATVDTNTVTASLQGDNAGKPDNSNIAGSAVDVAETSIGSEAYITFTPASPIDISATGEYYLVVNSLSEASSTGIFYQSGVTGGKYFYTTDSGTNWTLINTIDVDFKIYGCQ